jgi:hypothetical protein
MLLKILINIVFLPIFIFAGDCEFRGTGIHSFPSTQLVEIQSTSGPGFLLFGDSPGDQDIFIGNEAIHVLGGEIFVKEGQIRVCPIK